MVSEYKRVELNDIINQLTFIYAPADLPLLPPYIPRFSFSF